MGGVPNCLDVFAAQGTFGNKRELAQTLAAAVTRWQAVRDLALFRNNTAAFIHELPAHSFSNVAGDGKYVRAQVLTPGVLSREKQLGVVKELTDLVAKAAWDPGPTERTWVDRREGGGSGV